MVEDGGTAQLSVECPRDGTPTKLRCAECQTPICPACFVRTDVGLRCQICGAASGPAAASYGVAGSRRTPILVALAVVLALVVGGGFLATRGGSDGPAVDDAADGGERIVIPSVVLGNGELPGQRSWTLEARRDGGVCTTLRVTPGPSITPERCLRTRSYRPVGNTSTRILRSPAGTTYLTVGQASDRAERVRIAPDGAAPWEVPTLGGGTGLDIRFFVAYTTTNVPVSFTALAVDGTVLGRMDRPALPTS